MLRRSNKSRLYIYPTVDPKGGGGIKLASDATISNNLHHLYQHLLENGFIREMPGCLKEFAIHTSTDIRSLIENNDPAWHELVPEIVLNHPRWKSGE